MVVEVVSVDNSTPMAADMIIHEDGGVYYADNCFDGAGETGIRL